jgi:MYXO-CTERM domain-containing protein
MARAALSFAPPVSAQLEKGALMKCAYVMAGIAATAVASFASASVTFYSTGFDSSEGYTVGDISGQNGWSTFQPGAGAGYTNVTNSAPSGFGGDQALSMTSGIDANTSPRYAWPAGYAAQFTAAAAAGDNVAVSQCSMYMASGSTSTERTGMVVFDATGAKILTGFYVQANTGIVYLLANYNNAGTINNFAFNTNVSIGYNQWVNFTTTWNQATGRMEVFWGANGFFVDGAAAGSVADETDFYATRNGSTVANTVYFDNLAIGAVPTPGALALLGLAGLTARRRR